MKFPFRSTNIMVPVFAFVLIAAGCVKHPPDAERGPALPAAAQPGDAAIIVAKINGVALHKDMLVEMMNSMLAPDKRASAAESREETVKKALDRMVFEELAFQEAARQGLSVGEGVLNNAMAKLRAKLGPGYPKFLAQQNITEAEFRSRLKRSLLIQLIVDREVNRKTSIPDDDLQKEYAKQKDRFIIPEKVTVEDVVLFIDKDDPALMTKANKVLAQINADADKDPKNLTPDGTFFVRSLDIQKEREPALYDAALKLTPGELSGMIIGSDSIHFIKLTHYTPGRQLSFEEAKSSLEGTLKTAARKKRAQEWERELKKSAAIELLDPEDRGRKSADGSR
jgi:parvulin-like peptidyl-prolyl isomerase